MKIKEMFAIVVLALTWILPANGQPIPTGAHVTQPAIDGTRVDVKWVNSMDWPKECSLHIEFAKPGEIKEMTFRGGSADMGTEFEFEFPTSNTNTAFKSLEAWKKFAVEVASECILIENDVYVEKEPFTMMGRSVTIEHWETPDHAQALIFKRGERWLSIPVGKWVGKLPEAGQSIVIGQDGSGDVFFAAQKFGGEYAVAEEVTKRLKDRFVINVAEDRQ